MSDVQVQRWARRLPEAVRLSREAARAGLVVLKVCPHACGSDHFEVVFYAGDGSLWVEAAGETAQQVREHIRRYEGRSVVPVLDTWDEVRRWRVAAASGVAAAVRGELVNRAGMSSRWRDSVIDLVAGLERLMERGNHPDDVDRAIGSIMDLAGLWLDPGEAERVYLEGIALSDGGGNLVSHGMTPRWSVEPTGGVLRVLRNNGDGVTGLRRVNVPDQDLVRFDAAADGVVPAGGSFEFAVLEADQVPTPREICLVWDGQDEPVAVSL